MLAQAFEIGDKTRLGEHASDANRVRLLNRTLRLDEGGLSYEAGPRHVELWGYSLGQEEKCNIAATHGSTAAYEEAPVPDDNIDAILPNPGRQERQHGEPQEGPHPKSEEPRQKSSSQVVAGRDGVGDFFQLVRCGER